MPGSRNSVVDAFFSAELGTKAKSMARGRKEKAKTIPLFLLSPLFFSPLPLLVTFF